MNFDSIGYLLLIGIVVGFVVVSQVFSRKKIKQQADFLSKKLDEFGPRLSLEFPALHNMKMGSSAARYEPELLEARQFSLNKNKAYWVMATYYHGKAPALVLFLLVDVEKSFPSWVLGSTYDDGMVEMGADEYSADESIKKYTDGVLGEVSAVLMSSQEIESKIKQALLNVSQEELNSLMKAALSVECFNQYILVSFYFNDPTNLTEEYFSKMQRLAEIATTQILPVL